MNEEQYSVIHDLATVRAARVVMAQIVPDCCSDVIKKKQYQEVMIQLVSWEQGLNKLLEDMGDE